jgi:hypothetical protein
VRNVEAIALQFSAAQVSSFRSKATERGSLLVCVFASLAAMWLHLVFLTHAGALWRDEACGVATALMPTFAELWHFLPLDAAGLASPLLLRAWGGLGFGQSDFGWRVYGFLIGLAVLGVLWVNARLLGRKWPVVSLGLLAASPTLFRWGDSVRAYGLACLFMLLTLGAVWRLARRPSRTRFGLATVAAVLSVHALYVNAFLLLAVGLSAGLVCLRRRHWGALALVLSVGLIAALSLLPYAPSIRASSHNWWIIQKSGFLPGWVWFNLTNAAGTPYLWLGAVWATVALLTATAGLVSGWRRNHACADLHFFAGAAVMLAAGLFLLFIWMSGLPTQVWYFLPLLIFVAACANAVLPEALEYLLPAPARTPGRLRGLRVGAIAFAGAMVLISCPLADKMARPRQTNIDRVAAYLGAHADPGDLIVLHPWYCGVTFERYYHGQASWLTVPPIPDHRVQRFDLLMEQMRRGDPMPPVLQRCAEVLRSGHKLWMLGWFQFDGKKPPVLPRPPDGPEGWNEVPYEEGWAAQIPYLIVQHAGELAGVPGDPSVMISPFEDLSLHYARGWRTNSVPPP